MTSIVVYGTEPANPTGASAQADRITGMIEAGNQLKNAFTTADTDGDSFLSDLEVGEAVCAVVDTLAATGSGFDPVLEHKVGVTSSFYSIAPRANPPATIFKVTNLVNPADMRNLNLKGKVDTLNSNTNNYKMTTVAPVAAANTLSWQYLFDTVYLDLKMINAGGDDPVRTVNYLIATFAFTRCR
jgi:hypothetical protein